MYVVCRILALRICELDSAVQSPTMKLLEGYTSANVDLRCESKHNYNCCSQHYFRCIAVIYLFLTGDNEFNNLDHATNSNVDNIEENSIITNKNNVPCRSLPESPVMQQLQSIQMSLPKNLGVLVQKALNNLKDNDKQKI